MYHNPKKGTRMKDVYTTEIQHAFLKSKSPKFPKRLPFPNHHLFTIYISSGGFFATLRLSNFQSPPKLRDFERIRCCAALSASSSHLTGNQSRLHSLCSSYLKSSRMAKFGMVKWKLSKNDILSPNHQIFWIISDRIQYQCDYNGYTVYVYIMCIYIYNSWIIYIYSTQYKL